MASNDRSHRHRFLPFVPSILDMFFDFVAVSSNSLRRDIKVVFLLDSCINILPTGSMVTHVHDTYFDFRFDLGTAVDFWGLRASFRLGCLGFFGHLSGVRAGVVRGNG